MSSMGEGKESHSEYLKKLYELAKGRPREVDISELRKELDRSEKPSEIRVGSTQRERR